MSIPIEMVPRLPFEGFKWKWASLQCTEGINDPVVLLGVLARMRKLEKMNLGLTYRSDEFAAEMRSLASDIEGRGIGVDLARRTGERNLIRNSGQYWKTLGLIPNDSKGLIELTPFGRQIADSVLSQADFAAVSVASFTLPNQAIQSADECAAWQRAGLRLHPLALLLRIMRGLRDAQEAALLSKEELTKIIIPLSGLPNATVEDYVAFLRAYRLCEIDLAGWPNCTPSANDHRIAREFLLFLANYGFARIEEDVDGEETFVYNELVDDEITKILEAESIGTREEAIERLTGENVGREVERKRILRSQRGRPHQARFRQLVLGSEPRCVISNVDMPEVLIAAHIIPYRYHGADDASNGFCMRSDIHILYDANELRIHPDGKVELSQRARLAYGAAIPPSIVLPECIDRENLRWRCDNYRGF